MQFFWSDKYFGKKGVLAVPSITLKEGSITIYLYRKRFSALTTQGKLEVAGRKYDTLEPPDQEDKPRCIPPGTYRIVMEYSPKFKRILPELKNVPGFTEIKLHKGNYPQDTEGCILVGQSAVEDAVYYSGKALKEIITILKRYKNVFIEIVDERSKDED